MLILKFFFFSIIFKQIIPFFNNDQTIQFETKNQNNNLINQKALFQLIETQDQKLKDESNLIDQQQRLLQKDQSLIKEGKQLIEISQKTFE